MPKYTVEDEAPKSRYTVEDEPAAFSKPKSSKTLNIQLAGGTPAPTRRQVVEHNKDVEFLTRTQHTPMGGIVDNRIAPTPGAPPQMRPETVIESMPMAGAAIGGTLGGIPGAALGGAAGESLRQLVNRAVGREAPSSSSEAAKGIAVQGGLGALQELPGGVARGIGVSARVAEALPGKALTGTKGGIQLQREMQLEIIAKNEAKVAMANETADRTVQSFNPTPSPAFSAAQGGETLADTFRTQFLGGRDAMGQTVVGTEEHAWNAVNQTLLGKKADVRPIGRKILAVDRLFKRTQAKAGLKSLTPSDAEWDQLVKDMAAGMKGSVERGPMVMGEGPAYTSTVTGATIPGEPVEIAQKIVPKAPANMMENAASLTRARATASKRLYDLENGSGLPVSVIGPLRKGLNETIRGIDETIAQVTKDNPSAMALLKLAKEHSGAGRELMKGTIYKMMSSRRGDLAVALLDPKNPKYVDDLFEIAARTKDTTAVPDIQRLAIDHLLLKKSGVSMVPDVASFEAKLKTAGASGTKLFSTPEAKVMVNGLIEQSRAARDLAAVPNIRGLGVHEQMAEVLAAGTLGRGMGHYMWGVASHVVNKTTYAMAKIAAKPAANAAWLKAIRIYSKTGMASAEVGLWASRAIRLSGLAKEAQTNNPLAQMPAAGVPAQ